MGPTHKDSKKALAADDLAWLLVPAAALGLAAAFAWLAPPLSDLYPAPTHDVFTVWRAIIRPEPLEEVRSVLALATPVSVAHRRGDRCAFGKPTQPRSVIIVIQVAVGLLLIVAVLNQPQVPFLLRPDCCARFLVSIPNLIAGVADRGRVTTAGALNQPSPLMPASLRDALEGVRRLRWLAVLIALAATIVWILPAVNTDETSPGLGSLASSHIPVQGEDYFAAVNGRTPAGRLHLPVREPPADPLEPLLKAVGPSITSYSIGMCSLSAIAMAAIYGAFTQVTRGSWTALALYVPWVALSMYPWIDMDPSASSTASTTACFPHATWGRFCLPGSARSGWPADASRSLRSSDLAASSYSTTTSSALGLYWR